MYLVIVFLLALLMPTQLGLHFWPEWSYLFGLSVDYLSPTIFLTDALLAALLVSHRPKQKLSSVQLLLLSTLTVINLLTSINVVNTLVFVVRLILLANFTLVVASLSTTNLKKLLTTILFSTTFAAVIGILQFTKQSSLGGLFYFLGERTFSLTTPGIARFTLPYLDVSFLRSYSIFSHPNSFAGYLLATLMLILSLPATYLLSKKTKTLLLLPILIALLLTFSRNAVLATFIVSMTFFNSKVVTFKTVSLLLVAITVLTTIPLLPLADTSFTSRMQLNQLATHSIISNLVTGLGFNNFLIYLSSIIPPIDHKLLQPVHNLYLLVLSEFGLVSSMLAAVLLPKIKLSKFIIPALLIVLITSTLDHYWISLQQNRLLLAAILGLAINPHLNSKYS